MKILYFLGMKANIPGQFPNHLAVIRARIGLSQTEVASQLGITQPGYSNLEAGKSRLTADRARKLATILQCRIWELSDDFLEQPQPNAAEAQFREPQDAPPSKAKKADADPAAHDPILRIIRDYASGLKSKPSADMLMVVYAAVNRHLADYERRYHAAASEDYIRGVVAVKFEHFIRG